MRLLTRDSDGEITLTDDFTEPPPYAILSHTWGLDSEEVTFKDITDGTGKHKKGYKKLEFCAERAYHHKLKYFWVDTCCINKANCTELHQSIRSMFQWYHAADKCYVYLSDVSRIEERSREIDQSWIPEFSKSRWFSRGWTLQELLAPKNVEFYTSEGTIIGNKTSLESLVSRITGIPPLALQGKALSSFEPDLRFKWAEERQTTKPEDSVYCLLGIFGVSMSNRYAEGEGEARRRLNSKISRRSTPMLENLTVPVVQSDPTTTFSPPSPTQKYDLLYNYKIFNKTTYMIRKSALSVNINRFITGEDREVRVWTASRPGEYQETDSISSKKIIEITALSMSPSGNAFAFGDNSRLELFSYNRRIEEFEAANLDGDTVKGISTLTFSRNGRLLAAGYGTKSAAFGSMLNTETRGTDYGMKIWEQDQSSGWRRWHELTSITSVFHRRRPLDIKFAAGEEEKLICLTNQDIYVWKRGSGTEFQFITRSQSRNHGGFKSMAISPKGNLLAVSCGKGTAIWEINEGGGLRCVADPSPMTTSEGPIVFTPDGNGLVTCPCALPGNKRDIQIWKFEKSIADLFQVKSSRKLPCNGERVQSLGFLPNDDLMAISTDLRVRIWGGR